MIDRKDRPVAYLTLYALSVLLIAFLARFGWGLAGVLLGGQP